MLKTNEEVLEIIRKNYDVLSTEEIGKLIGKSGNAVRKIAFTYGITKMNKIYETKHDEVFKCIDGFPNYEISNYGTLRNSKTGTYVKWKTAGEYPTIRLTDINRKRINFKVHRLVASLFIENPENKETVNHIDGNKMNAYYKNLEWCTQSENQKHAYDTGLKKSQKGIPNKKYTEEQVRSVCEELECGELSEHKIGEKIGVPRSLVKDIKSRKTHIKISSEYNF